MRSSIPIMAISEFGTNFVADLISMGAWTLIIKKWDEVLGHNMLEKIDAFCLRILILKR